MAAVGRGPASPLVSVNRSKVAVRVGPLVPDRHAVRVQRANVRFTPQKPQQLVDDRLCVDLLRSQQWKAAAEIAAHLIAENRQRPRPRAIVLALTAIADVTEEIEIGLHGWSAGRKPGAESIDCIGRDA